MPQNPPLRGHSARRPAGLSPGCHSASLRHSAIERGGLQAYVQIGLSRPTGQGLPYVRQGHRR